MFSETCSCRCKTAVQIDSDLEFGSAQVPHVIGDQGVEVAHQYESVRARRKGDFLLSVKGSISSGYFGQDW
jgi:hypothetical protein